MGDRQQHLHRALFLMERQGCAVKRISDLLETPPWGIIRQPSFLNAVCEVVFSGSAHDLLALLLEIENHMGRVRTEKWGPRIIDLDILEFNREIHHTPALILPHPFYPEREFVLAPLAELEPHWIPTGMRTDVSELLFLARSQSATNS